MTTAARVVPLLSDRNFALFWVSQSISGFGDQLTVIALAALVWNLTRSSLVTALVVIVSTVPHAFFGFFAGPIADTFGRRRTLVACDATRMVAVCCIPLAIAANLPLLALFVLVLVATFAAALFTPTKAALLPELLHESALARGNAFVQMSDRTIEIGGKAIAGVLFLAIGPAVFFVDAITFLLSALLLAQIRLAEAPTLPVSLRGTFADASTGLRVIGESVVLSANLVFSLAAQVSVAVANTLLPVFLFRELQAGPDAFGAAEAVLAAGVVLASLFAPALIERTNKGRLVVAAFAAQGASLLALWVAPRLEVVFVLLFLGGCANAIYLISNVTIYQENTKPEFRGRVFSTRYALLNLVWLPVMVVSGALAERMSAAELIGLAGAFTLLVAIAGSFVRSIRDVS
jgi:MFS family permease